MTERKDAPKKRPRTTRPKKNGPAPVPNEVHRKRGNPSKKNLPDEATVHKLPGYSGTGPVPEPPRPLGERGREAWDRSWVHGHLWLSKTSDIEALTVLCEQLDEREALRKYVLENPNDWRQRGTLRSLEKQIIDGLQILGFTPTDRARMGIAEVRPESDAEAFRRQMGADG